MLVLDMLRQKRVELGGGRGASDRLVDQNPGDRSQDGSKILLRRGDDFGIERRHRRASPGGRRLRLAVVQLLEALSKRLLIACRSIDQMHSTDAQWKH